MGPPKAKDLGAAEVTYKYFIYRLLGKPDTALTGKGGWRLSSAGHRQGNVAYARDPLASVRNVG